MKFIINDFYAITTELHNFSETLKPEILKLKKETKSGLLLFHRNGNAIPVPKQQVHKHYPRETHPEMYL